jgi:hypothetical protein
MRRELDSEYRPLRAIVGIIAACGLCLFALGAAAQTPDTQPAPPADRDRSTEDLARRLIEGESSADDGDVMEQLLTLMNDAQNRLHREFDPGDPTQTVQRRIIERLDDAIKLALMNRSESSAPPQDAGDMREMPPSDKEKKSVPDPSASGEESQRPAAKDAASGEDLKRRMGDLRELRRGWGNLPQRDREEIMQGLEEASLDRYRDMIERYYRALAETENP